MLDSSGRINCTEETTKVEAVDPRRTPLHLSNCLTAPLLDMKDALVIDDCQAVVVGRCSETLTVYTFKATRGD